MKSETLNELLAGLAQTFGDQIPFNKLVGLSIDKVSVEEVMISFEMKPELVGNFMQGILHGGVIATVLDVAGGTLAAACLMERYAEEHSLEEIAKRFAKLGTIDLRIDYLRPGRGERFISRATVLRAGNKVAVTRMEMMNGEGVLIAVGTGTYLVG
ncbi:MAG: thioesterase family protein [Gammaproteobacteria bacterium]|nr:thioesterase family protein [Gammaproteobacteria bacterium]